MVQPVHLQVNPEPKYTWRLLRAGPLRLDGGSMFGVVPRGTLVTRGPLR